MDPSSRWALSVDVYPSWKNQRKPQLCPIWGTDGALWWFWVTHTLHQVPSTQGSRCQDQGSVSFQLCDLGVLISLSGLNVILGSAYDGDRCYSGIQISWMRHRWADTPGHLVICKDPYTQRQGHWACDLESTFASCASHLPCDP